MKKTVQLFIFLSIMGITVSCGSPDKSDGFNTKNSKHQTEIEVKTQYGSLPGNYSTQDEYYVDESGSKVWHGHRKTFYPTGALRMDATYEHGKEVDWKKYDEVGNLIGSKN